ncbi:DUF6531 domain-containing protein [Amycolatopsis sp. 505]|uniref:DUF6531 domain-containing protein n=2 Tax=unclassified Amycolatopsis TaxID=2618356 RepID=UPI00287496CC|nr:DUF6531 domain-containing protein [Amycolatopsis sp. 505]MDS0134294.1 RHS repeat protein [Amycolatopsis sp. 505]
MANPLVAETKDSTKAYSGISLLETANDLKSAIESGDWASVALGAVGTALDALSMAMDPFGAILAAGVGWLIEHVGPLKEALNGLTGNADEIAAQSETWKNIATELGSVGEDLTGMVTTDIASWTGAAADTYRQRAQDTVTLLETAQKGCEGASSGVKTAGEVVAAVRALVRDIIAELVGHLISWALQVVFTLGIGMTWVVPQVINAVAKTASKIADLVKRLVTALKALIPLLKRAGDLFSDAAKALRKIKPGKTAPPPKHADIKSGPKDIGGPKGKGDGDGTTTSGAKGDGTSPSGAKGDPPPKTDAPPKTDPPPKSDPPDGTPPPPKDGPPGATPKGGADGGGKPKGDPKGDGPRDRAVPDDKKVCVSDPVDVATGEVVLKQVDLTLPGDAGDLELSRTHLSAYRGGRWFGRSWASTLDQRLEADRDHLRFFAEDGMVLVYPRPDGDRPVLPIEGPRHPLRRTGGGYRLSAGPRDLVFADGGGRVLPLTGIEQGGSRTTIEHDESGAPSLLRRDDGTEIGINAGAGRIIALGVPGGAPVVRYGYNRLGQLTQIAGFTGRPVNLDYDVDDRIVGWQDRTGTWYRYVYDAEGRCVRSVGAERYLNGAFAYDTGTRTTRHTDALGQTWVYRMNEAGQLVERTDPLGHTRRYSWTRYDDLLSQTDELGRITFYGYENGVLTTVTRPDGSEVRLTPAGAGEVELRAGDARAVAPAADPYAALPGVSTRLRVDGTDVFGDEPVLTAAVRPGDRDPFGRPRLVHTASGGAAKLGWTAEGQRAWRIGPGGERESWRHDGEGRVVEHRDAAGRTTRRTYGPFGLPIEEFDAAGARTAYGYDAELRLTAVTNPRGQTWRYTYDPAGRLVEETDFDGRRLTYAYDEAGQLRRMTNGAGEVTEYAYDVLGNVVERRTATGVTGYAYDALGQLEYAINNESVLQIVRDERGRVREETVNGVGVRWTYDAAGVHRTTLSGVDSEWRYDGDRPVSLRVRGHEIAFEYDEAGRETARSVDGTVVLRQVFDASDRIGEQTIAGVGRRAYTYTPDGRLAAIDDTRPVRFGFDAAGRVAEVHAPEGVERFAYDPAGRLVPPSGTRYGHDPQGRVIGTAGWRFVWDELDRLVAAIGPDESFWTYLYDPLGRRFAKRRWILGDDGAPRQTAETWFVWSGGELVEEIEVSDDGSSRVLTWERHPDDGRPVVQVEQRGAEVRFHTVVTSPAGTPTELLAPDGGVEWQARRSFWGELLPSTSGSAPMPLAFPGQYRDAETGLHYNVYRYYDPRNGRYLSQDPLGLAAAPDPVGYVEQPHLQGDPLGLVQSPCGKTGGPKSPDNPAGGGDAGKLPPGAKKPDGLGEFRDPDGKIRPHNMTDEQYAKFSKKWDEMMAPGKDKSWFWSGGHITDAKVDPVTGTKISDSKYHGSIEDPAINLAKKNGGNTLEGILKDNGVEMPKFSDNHPNGEKVWKDASKALAHNAQGDVHIALPNTPGKSSGWADQGDELASRRPNNVFDMDEFPILRHNPKVDKVWAHDVNYPDAPPVVIWDRTKR